MREKRLPHVVSKFSGSFRLPKMDQRTLHSDINKARRRVGHCGVIHVYRGRVLVLRHKMAMRRVLTVVFDNTTTGKTDWIDIPMDWLIDQAT